VLETYYAFVIPQGKRVLEIGCGSGDLLNAVKPCYGVGIDFVPEVIEMAKMNYPAASNWVSIRNKFYILAASGGELYPNGK
jgi:ubiquinone/menaquinone biosynthesis C-methylase UbiE